MKERLEIVHFSWGYGLHQTACGSELNYSLKITNDREKVTCRRCKRTRRFRRITTRRKGRIKMATKTIKPRPRKEGTKKPPSSTKPNIQPTGQQRGALSGTAKHGKDNPHGFLVFFDPKDQQVKARALTDLSINEGDLPARIRKLEKELNKNAGFVYSQAILATPSGELRNKLTELNIRRMQLLKNEFEDMLETGDIYADLLSTPNSIVAGEEEIIISRLTIELDIMMQMFLKVEDLSQRGSNMEGHELSLELCIIIHPELYQNKKED